jgi:hypothetical protein
LFPSSTLGAQAFAALSDVVGELSEHGSTLLSGSRTAREGTTTKAVAPEALREHLEAIVRRHARSRSTRLASTTNSDCRADPATSGSSRRRVSSRTTPRRW